MSVAATPIDRPILFRPTDRQAEFLAAAEDEVLYGGAAGGGKSTALAIDALGLQQGAIHNPRYRAIVFRKTFPQLKDFIDRTRALYPAIVVGARYLEQARLWRFPSGAELIFGAIEADDDVQRYQGPEYQWIGFEELTTWASSHAWDFMRTRLRGTDLRRYMRATCNPGDVGGRWVQERWQIPDDGAECARALPVAIPPIGDEPGRTVTAHLRFVPARLSDNPFIDPDYAANLARMPEQRRRALLGGRWDVYDVPGAIYAGELAQLREGGRLTRVPHDPAAPVLTAWDLGIGDYTSVWCLQQIGREVHAIDFIQNKDAALGEYLVQLAIRRDTQGWRFARHLMPHDAQARELMSGNKSRAQFVRDSGLGPVQIVPQAPLEDGIHATKLLLSRLWIDAARCEAGVASLSNYRRTYSNTLSTFNALPVHDWASHGADALRCAAMGLRPPPPAAAPKPAPREEWYVPPSRAGWMGM